jgi:hypothetical protein
MAGYPVIESLNLNNLLFDNASQFLTTTSCPATDSKYVFSGDFTIEAWINMTTLPAAGASKNIVSSYSNNGVNKSFWFGINNVNGQNFLQLWWSTDGLNWLNINSALNSGTVQAPYTFQAATWYHVVASRSGNNYNLFINGFLVGQYTAVSAVANFAGPIPITIGIDYNLTYFFNGYISNLRVVKGTAVYTAASSSGTTYYSNSTVSYTNPNQNLTRSFLPPTVNLTATQSAGGGSTNINAIGGNSTVNTSLLVCQNVSASTYTAAFVDNSSYAQVINPVGYNPNVNRVGTPALPYPGYFSTSFSGTTQALSTAITANTSWVMGNGDFTVEAWVYINTLAVSTGIVSSWAGTLAAPTANACCFSLSTGVGNAANVRFTISNTTMGTATANYESTSAGLVVGQWNHVAAVRIANTLNIYTNGVKTYAGSAGTETTNINCANAVCVIGGVSTTGGFINAYISNARVTKAVGAYSNTFTPYQYPLANSLTSNVGLTNYNTIAAATGTSSGVQLLACRYRTLTPENSFNAYALTSTGAPVAFANVVPQFIPTDNNLLSLAQQPKYIPEAGNTYLTIPGSSNFNLGTGPFTIETWVYTQNIATGPTFISQMPLSTGSVGNWALGITTTGFVTVNYDGAAALTTTSLPVSANTWTHVAVTRSAAGVYAVYVNGAVATGTVTSQAQFGNTTNSIWVGCIQSTGPTQYLYGYTNNIRITRGIVVYTGAFTPPTSALSTTQSAGTNIAAIPLAANVGLLIQANSTTGAISDVSPTASTISIVSNSLANNAGVNTVTFNSVYNINMKSFNYKQLTSAANIPVPTRKLAIQSFTSVAEVTASKAVSSGDRLINFRKNALQQPTSSAKHTAKATSTIDTIKNYKSIIQASVILPNTNTQMRFLNTIYTDIANIPIVSRKNALLSSTSIAKFGPEAVSSVDTLVSRKNTLQQPTSSAEHSPKAPSIPIFDNAIGTNLYKQPSTSYQFWS